MLKCEVVSRFTFRLWWPVAVVRLLSDLRIYHGLLDLALGRGVAGRQRHILRRQECCHALRH